MNRSRFLRMTTGIAVGGVLGHLCTPGPAQASMETARMSTRPIPSTGEQLPVVGCGTWQTFDIGNSAPELDQRAQVLDALFESGGSVIDSSPMYGRAEQVVGKLLARSGQRRQAFIATKVWTRGRAAGIDQMERSMSLLGADPIDLMQVHNLLDWQIHLATLRDWKERGRVRYVGVTHYTSSAYAQLESLIREQPLDFVQFNYSAEQREAERRLLPLAAERGLAVIINLPFGGGGLLRRLSGNPLPGFAQELDCSSWAQLLLKFVLSQPAVTCVIPGTSKPGHMLDNARAGFGTYPDSLLRERIAQAVRQA